MRNFGAGEGTRTPDLWITNPLLYQLSYAGSFSHFNLSPLKVKYNDSVFTWPNLITVLRLLLIPLIVIALFSERKSEALVLFVLAGLSDALDGLLARKLGQKSLLGAVMDPLADKFLLDTIYVLCAWKGYLPAFLAVLVVSRDVFIVSGFLVLYLFSTPPEINPTRLSKANTTLQVVTAASVLASLSSSILEPLFYLTAAFTVTSGLHYLYLGFKAFPHRPGNQSPAPPSPGRSHP